MTVSGYDAAAAAENEDGNDDKWWGIYLLMSLRRKRVNKAIASQIDM